MVQLPVRAISDGAAPSSKHQMQNGSAKGSANGSAKTGRGTMANWTTGAPQRQNHPRPQTARKTSLTRQECSSCSSIASCPIFSGRHTDQEEDPPPRCSSSLSSPSLHKFVSNSSQSPKGSLPSLQGSLPSLKGSISGLRRSLASLDHSSPGPHSSSPSPSPSLRSSSPSLHSSSPSLQSTSSSSVCSGSSSEDDSWDTNSWSSGATCLLRTSIKQHSDEVFRARANSPGPGGRANEAAASDTSTENVYQTLGNCEGDSGMDRAESQEEAERVLKVKWDSTQSLSSSSNQGQGKVVTFSAQQEQKLEERLKFSQFLDEVTNRVLVPGSPWESFNPVRQRALAAAAASWYSPMSSSLQPIQELQEPRVDCFQLEHQWNKYSMPSCKVLDPGEGLRKVGQVESCFHSELASVGRTYLETDIDIVRRQDELEFNGTLERGRESPWDRERGRERERRTMHGSPETPRVSFEGLRSPSPCPVLSWPQGVSPNRSTSLPRPVSKTVSDGKMYDMSSLHDHKDDLRKRLSYTTHKLEMVESEFDSTRQYLETELRRAQEELEKFTDKLRRIQSSYAAQQRINQDLEDKVHRTTQHHEDEKRALSREIIVLNNHLMEAKITIEKLREDNDLYRKDCNLAAQLLQCSKSHHRAHKLSELPIDFQERVSSHMEKQGRGVTMALCHSPYTDAVPTAVIAKVLEKPEPGSSCPNTRSPSPQPLEDEGHDHNFVPTSVGGGTESLRRRTAYRTSDLYCSDTALYCPERWQERRQSVDVHARPMGLLQAQNSTDSNPEEEAFHSGNFSHHGAPSFHGEFAVGSLRASSSYSSFSQASEDEKGGEGCGGGPSSTISSSHQGLYMDWRDGGYGERKSTSSYEKDSPPGHSVFPKSHSFQHMAMPPSPNPAKGGGGSSPAYVCTASCGYSEPYHSPLIASSHSVGSAQGGGGPRGAERSDSQASIGSMGVPTEEELTGRWRQLSVEDINSYSFNRNPGRVSPYSFSEQHFAMGPAKIKLGPLYSSFQEGDDNVFLHSHVLDQCLAAAAGGGLSPSPSPSPKHPSLGLRGKPDNPPPLYRAKVDSQDSECSLQFLSGSHKDKESGAAGAAGGSMNKEYVDVSPNSSAESLHHQSSLEASSLQHYQRERMRPSPSPALPKKSSQQYQKFGSTGTGLSRKDSLTKAQLYGTLLN